MPGLKSKHKLKYGKEFTYYLTLFKIEGHETWRANLSMEVDGFEKNLMGSSENYPKVTEKNVFKFDRLTGGLMSKNL